MADVQAAEEEELSVSIIQQEDTSGADISESQEDEENTEISGGEADVEDQDDEEASKINPELLKAHKFYNRALIFVMSGLHKGAGCAVTEETTIGSNFDNDLILTDEDIVSTHLALRPIEDGLNYAVEVICRGDSLIINGEILLTTEQTLVMEETFVVTIGMVNINVTLHKASRSTVAYQKYMAPKIKVVEELTDTAKKYISPQVIFSDIRNIVLLIISIIILFSGIIYYLTMATPKKYLRSDYTLLREIKSVPIKERSDNLLLHQQARDDLLRILQKYDLSARLDVSLQKNILYVKGRINKFEVQNWRKVLNWFDGIYSKDVNLVPLIKIDNGLRRTISFKAVVTSGNAPYVVAWTGGRYKVGSTLPGGWIILKIDDEGVVVKDAVDNRIFLVEHIRARHGTPLPNFRE